MKNAGDAAEDLIEGLREAANQTASLATATGLHNFSLAVYANNPSDLDSIVADASKTLSQVGGAAPMRELNLWYSGAIDTLITHKTILLRSAIAASGECITSA